MKPLAILQGFLYGSITFFLGPFLFININEVLSLPILEFTYSKYIAFTIALVVFLAFLYCVDLFWFIGKGTPALAEPPKKLVIKGFYKYTTNPIYITHSFILFSYALFFGHLMLYVYSILAILFYHSVIVFYEEPKLKREFGEEYSNYSKNVPRWLPRFNAKN